MKLSTYIRDFKSSTYSSKDIKNINRYGGLEFADSTLGYLADEKIIKIMSKKLNLPCPHCLSYIEELSISDIHRKLKDSYIYKEASHCYLISRNFYNKVVNVLYSLKGFDKDNHIEALEVQKSKYADTLSIQLDNDYIAYLDINRYYESIYIYVSNGRVAKYVTHVKSQTASQLKELFSTLYRYSDLTLQEKYDPELSGYSSIELLKALKIVKYSSSKGFTYSADMLNLPKDCQEYVAKLRDMTYNQAMKFNSSYNVETLLRQVASQLDLSVQLKLYSILYS